MAKSKKTASGIDGDKSKSLETSTEAVNMSAEELAGEANRLAKADPNLFLRPWVALWRGEARSAVINLEWEEDHPTIKGRKIKASWKVTGDAELGLPTPGDRRLFNVLCEMTREQELSQTVNFTRYGLLQRMGRGRSKRDYELLLQSFERLKGVKITARNVFRDARTGLIEDAVFSIIDDVTIVKPSKSGRTSDEELPLSTFSWSDRIYNNIQSGFLLTFDLNIAQLLHSDVALILYPLLLAKTYDGPGRRRNHFHSELRDFYENHLGMRSTRYVSKMEERLLPGHEELKQIGFLADAKIEPMKAKGQYKITYTLNLSATAEHDEIELPMGAETAKSTAEIPPAAKVKKVAKATALRQRMVAIGVEENMAETLEQQFENSILQLQLDCLNERHPRDPAALFLYAVRRDLPPPGAYLERIEHERHHEAERAASEGERRVAVARAQHAGFAREEARRQLETTCAFYESLSDRAKAIVRQRVDVELDQFGAQGRLLYPHPDWVQVLGNLLCDESWATSLGQWEDDWDDNENEPASEQNSLFPRLELYADTLRSLLHNGQADAAHLEKLREKSFPLLSEDEWEDVKNQALNNAA